MRAQRILETSFARPPQQSKCSVPDPENASLLLRYPCSQPYLLTTGAPAHRTHGWQPRECSDDCGPDVLVAHCVAGLDRGFSRVPSMYRSFRQNLVSAMGGQAVVMLLLKTFGTSPKSHTGRRAGHFEQQVAKDYVREWGPVQRESMLNVLHYLQPQIVSLSAREDSVLNPMCRLGAGDYGTSAGEVRHVGQLSSSYHCLEQIQAFEHNHAVRFALVTRARPDVVYLAPITPHYAYTGARLTYSSSKDFFYVMPRVCAFRMLNLLVDEYHQCNGTAWWRGRFETLVRHAANDVCAFASCSDAVPVPRGGPRPGNQTSVMGPGFPIGVLHDVGQRRNMSALEGDVHCDGERLCVHAIESNAVAMDPTTGALYLRDNMSDPARSLPYNPKSRHLKLTGE